MPKNKQAEKRLGSLGSGNKCGLFDLISAVLDCFFSSILICKASDSDLDLLVIVSKTRKSLRYTSSASRSISSVGRTVGAGAVTVAGAGGV